MKTSTLHHLCIQTNSYESSLSFYRDVLGFEVVKETSNFHGRYYNSWLRSGSFMIELQTPRIGERFNEYSTTNEGIVHFCIYTGELQLEYARLKQLGFDRFLKKGEQDIYEVFGSRLFKITAPEGTIIEVRDNADI